MTHVARAPHVFKWQGGYGAFPVSTRGVPVVRACVLNQAEHHPPGTLYHHLERVEGWPVGEPHPWTSRSAVQG
jgi:putative transposase